MPDAKAILLAQIDGLIRDLARTEGLLDTIPSPFDRNVRERAKGKFAQLIEGEREKLTELGEKVANGSPLDACWNELPAISARAADVFGESLAFLQGSLARANELDNNLCRLADALLDELSTRSGIGWERFTILAQGELFAGMVDIIRVRFPDTSVWSLPVVSHEFGHFAGPRLTATENGRTVHPFETLVEREEQRRWLPRHVHELFADVLATYTLGPAYAFTCIVGRFEPTTAYKGTNSHPAPADRVHAILSTLAKIEEEPDHAGAFGRYTGELREAWDGVVTGAGQPPALAEARGAEAVADLDRLVQELYSLVKGRLQPPALYGFDRFLEAQRVAAALKKAVSRRDGSLPQIEDGVQLADVLNGGWIARWRDWASTGDLTTTVFKLCESIRAERAAQ